MLRVGLTGGIGSGKSTVAHVFRALDVPVFEADVEGRRLLDEDPAVRRSVAERFGIVLRDGKIDRSALADIVFKDEEALGDLNAIIHPAVRRGFERWTSAQDAAYVMMEAAILGKDDRHRDFDRIVVVSAPEQLRIARVMKRDARDEQAVRDRMANQLSEKEQLSIAHHVVHNDDVHLVIPQVLAIHQELLLATRS